MIEEATGILRCRKATATLGRGWYNNFTRRFPKVKDIITGRRQKGRKLTKAKAKDISSILTTDTVSQNISEEATAVLTKFHTEIEASIEFAEEKPTEVSHQQTEGGKETEMNTSNSQAASASTTTQPRDTRDTRDMATQKQTADQVCPSGSGIIIGKLALCTSTYVYNVSVFTRIRKVICFYCPFSNSLPKCPMLINI